MRVLAFCGKLEYTEEKTQRKKRMKQYQNYLFDLYGTLADVHTDERKDVLWFQMSIFLQAQGLSCTPQMLKQLYASEIAEREEKSKAERGQWAEIDIAPVFASFYEQCGQTASAEQIAQLAWFFRLCSLEKLKLFDGVQPMLTKLKQAGKQVYLLSNAQMLFTLPELKALGILPYFDGIVISSQEGCKKPDRNLYEMVLRRYDLKKEETVMVGNDDQADCWGAAKAGLDSMYICTEQSPKRTEPLPDNCRLLPDIGAVY